MNHPFWLVWNENGRAPTVKHQNIWGAKNEAERLARINPGQRFHVLEVIGTCAKQDIGWDAYEKVRSQEEIPF